MATLLQLELKHHFSYKPLHSSKPKLKYTAYLGNFLGHFGLLFFLFLLLLHLLPLWLGRGLGGDRRLSLRCLGWGRQVGGFLRIPVHPLCGLGVVVILSHTTRRKVQFGLSLSCNTVTHNKKKSSVWSQPFMQYCHTQQAERLTLVSAFHAILSHTTRRKVQFGLSLSCNTVIHNRQKGSLWSQSFT